MNPPQPLPLAELARTILARARYATLSTLSRRHDGAPYGSLVQCLVADDGAPIFFLSRLAAHTQNLEADPRASCFVVDALRPEDPLAGGRLSIVGRVERQGDELREAQAQRLVAAHPGAARTLGFGDFAFYKLVPAEVRVIAGFGRMTWLSPQALAAAAPDPLALDAAGIVAHMNEDHADALRLYAAVHAGLADVRTAIMVWIDRLGFDLVATVGEGAGEERHLRLAFDQEAPTPALVRQRLVTMARAARESAEVG